MESSTRASAPAVATEYINWHEFITDQRPGFLVNVRGLEEHPSGSNRQVHIPDVEIYCDTCKQVTRSVGMATESKFMPSNPMQFLNITVSQGIVLSDSCTPIVHQAEWHNVFIQYSCRECRQHSKLLSIRLSAMNSPRGKARAIKLGEWPLFAPRIPTKLITLVGPDRDLFLQGRRAELSNLGIGAFSYYRRVVENQKNRIIDEIIRVAKKRAATPDVLGRLAAAKEETQFSKAVDSVKDVIPEILYIKGHNPLTLLHTALSKGLHERSDDECLTLAHSIRTILGELAERAGQVLRDDREIDKALVDLLSD